MLPFKSTNIKLHAMKKSYLMSALPQNSKGLKSDVMWVTNIGHTALMMVSLLAPTLQKTVGVISRYSRCSYTTGDYLSHYSTNGARRTGLSLDLFPHSGSGMPPHRKFAIEAESPGCNDNTPENVEMGSNRIMVQQMYETLNSTRLCGASCVIVRSPPPAQLMFRFDDDEYFKSSMGNSIITAAESHQRKGKNDLDNSDKDDITVYGEIDCSHSTDSFTVLDDDISTAELVFGRNKEGNNKSRLNKFVGGRVALRRALKLIDEGDSPNIFKDEHGAPVLPRGIIGSISHKDDVAVGVAMCNLLGGQIGVDIERCHNKAATLLSRRLLTDNEQQCLGNIPGITSEEEVLLRFSFKESVFKAVHPFVLRPVGFTEVEIQPRADGTAEIIFQLVCGGSFKYEAVWLRYRDLYWLTCVYFDTPSK